MCGICGFVAPKNQLSAEPEKLVRDMTQVLAHRGPDDAGAKVWDSGDFRAAMGHRRLSIIDLSPKGAQPMANEDRTLWVAFNGEIYNYRELKEKLRARGHVFRSGTDTETILHQYEEEREGCLERFNGMFAFSLWDAKETALFLARDPSGIKPLFFALVKGGIYFASEIKSLLLVPGLSRETDPEALDAYFTFGYIPGDRTVFKDIRKLLPGSFLRYQNKAVSTGNFGRVEYLPKHGVSEDHIKEELEAVFSRSIKRHLVSDVPVGVFLSGGLDSSLVTVFASKESDEALDAFSMGWEGIQGDEVDYAKAVAGHCRVRHNIRRVSARGADILPRLLWYLDEPFFDNSILPTWLVSRFAREKVKVVLSGDGGDEVFGGYEWTRRNQYGHYYKRIPGIFRALADRVSPGLSLKDEYGTNRSSQARRLWADLNGNMDKGFMRRTSVSPRFRRHLYSPDFQESLKGFDAAGIRAKSLEHGHVDDERERMLAADAATYLPDDCLFKVDRMSMAHGLEVRVPFLDRELVGFAARLPFDYKIRGLASKYILKKTFSQYLPEKILAQRKQGFTVPVSAWLRQDLYPVARSLLMSDTFEKRGLFNASFVRWMLKAHKSGQQELGHRIWGLMVFEVWARLYLDEKIKAAPETGLGDMV